MILQIENPKDFTQKQLELINKFSKVAGYKINIQKSVAFLYTNDEISERDCKQTIHLKNCSQKNKKHLEINFTREVKDLHAENYKTLIKEIEDDSKKRKEILFSWIGRINIVKMPILLKAIFSLM